MSKLQKSIYNFITGKSRLRKLVMSLAVVVVFVTTYLLILPALTLEKEEAAQQGGIDVPAVTEVSETEEAVSEEAAEAEETAEPETDGGTVEESEAAEPEPASDTEQASDASEDGSAAADRGASMEKEVLTSDGRNYKVTVEYSDDADIPENADLSVTEIKEKKGSVDGATEYEEYIAKTQEALGLESGAFEYIRIFDIKIVDENGEKVTISAPVDVKLELADKDSSKKAEASTQVVHFADGAENGEVVEKVEVDGEAVSFEAEGFSAYAIVEGPAAVPLGWHKVESLEQLAEMAAYGLYIGQVDGYYLTDGVGNVNNTSRTGIIKTKPAQSSPAGTSAVPYYFEAVEGGTNQYKIYCLDGNEKKYIVQTTNSLNLTTENRATVFTIETGASGTVFRAKGTNGYYINMQGGKNGNVFAAYQSATDENAQLNFWYHDQITDDPYELDGKSYGLMNWAGGAAGKALMAQSSGDALEAKALAVLSTSDDSDHLFAPNDSDISMWTFHSISEDLYYLTAVVDGSTKYLRIDSSGLSLVSEPDDNCKIQVVPGTGVHAGEICLRAGGATLTYSGSVDTGFSVGGEVGSEWLYITELSELTSDYTRTYSAEKVSVSDPAITNGSKVIVYTRYWNEQALRYDYYAISSDGTLVPVYESGNTIEWNSGQINELLWNFVEYYWEGTSDPNYYYELYSQYSEKYLAPQVADGQILADDPIGINLNGRRDGRYYSTVLAWDDDAYSFAGLKVVDGQIVSCPKSEAMDFYFAVMNEVNVDDDIHTVPTVEHTQYGITMKMKNFGTRKEMSDFLGNDDGGIGSTLHQGLLSTDLGSNGYPTTAGGSLGTLYSGASEVNHLFLQGTYDETGYFEFDSTQNFATLKGSDFKVYKELGTYDGNDRDSLKHGQFFPYNDLKPGVFTSVNKQNLFNATVNPLSDSDPRKYEHLYNTEHDGQKTDFYFGMEIEAGFTQTPSGLDAWGHDIIFEFTGDDDFWLYVDGELVIDLGGIHSAVPGSVNFSTGAVNVNGKNTTLRALFESNYKKRNPGASAADVAAFLSQYFDEGSTVFKDNTDHTMRIFYMERGAGASNLHMRFNLAAVRQGTVQLSKKLSGVDSTEDVMSEFPYQIWYKTGEGEEKLLTNKVSGDPERTKDYVFYKDSVLPVKYRKNITIAGKNYDDVFFLKPDETADINFPEGMTSYRITECAVNTEVYSSVKANGDELRGEGTGNHKEFGIDYATTDDRSKVKYDNTVNPEALRNLTIQKKLFKEDGRTPIPYADDQTEFTFRLYLAPEFGELDLANMYTYHVKDQGGNYCKWNSLKKQFESLEKTSYDALTPAQKEAASFHTSVYGSITRIPIDYTIELRNVLAGTKYRVEERPEEVPDGYSFQKYSDYDTENAAETDLSNRLGVNGTIVSGADPHVAVCNLKGWGLRVNKVWSDKDYMAERDPAYFAVFIERGESRTMVPNTLYQMPYSAKQTLYWYFQHLEPGAALEEYAIREVGIKGTPIVDGKGEVTNVGELVIEPVEPGGELDIEGRQKGETQSSTFKYSVLYNEGHITDDSNVRVDEVINNRPGIILKKAKWNGSEPLAGATFTLTDSNSNLIGTFTSDEDGLITVAFLSDDTDYILTETDSPQGWYGLQDPITIRLHKKKIEVAPGADEDYYIIDNESATPKLTIKDKPYTFKAIKKDANTEAPMAGVEFALHRQVTVDGVTSIDLNPMPGYESLITDSDGVIPKLDNTLPAGTYELRELSTLEGYELISKPYPQFTVTETGDITIGVHSDQVEFNKEETEENVEFVLTVLNARHKKVSVWKTDEGYNAITTGATFELYNAEDYDSDAGRPKEGKTPVVTGTTGDNGILTLGELNLGEYKLVETAAPDGFYPSATAISITVEAGRVIASQDGSPSDVDQEGDPHWVTSQDPNTYQVRVWNGHGYELPQSGGIGTTIFYVLGSVLLAGSVMLLILRRKRLI